ncbi:transcriptional regulator, MarR family [Mesorhizobium australicum]|uniref:Transcriptional regulator, MarR family n=2 Tax=Mesorhizobium australicum TaxID=536018 RepID=A0A1X7PBI3_9HYPH|nr:transcriptional regulator, MarR family [Mesorhizobium australicum]
MDNTVLETAFVDELSKVNRKLRTMFDARVKAQGLTLARARLLMHLAKNEGATQSELASALEIEQASIVSLLDALQKKDLVVRRAVKDDRRANGIFLTAKARSEADAILAFVVELRRQILAGIDEKDLSAATDVLKHVSRNIGAVA